MAAAKKPRSTTKKANVGKPASKKRTVQAVSTDQPRLTALVVIWIALILVFFGLVAHNY
ncbi:MAG TPA: hypothetical protein VGO07_01985 [Candidatus Saccharimonadales bacterium]|jgi:hypothetical protein|nr:hypothetical protein [Candidatus Saccharimonadales bacterium]